MTGLGPTATPVLAIARAEIRSRWRALLLIGLLAGVVGAVAVSSIALARRTTTAYDRLGTVTKVDDARGTVLGHPELVDEIVGLPMVTASWTGGIGVAQIEGETGFIGMIAGPRTGSDIIDPIVIEGRLPDATAEPGIIEVVLREDFQREVGLPIGTDLAVQFLSEADYFRFDTGFEGGQPHGPRAVVRVVGTVRLAGGFTTLPPALAGAAALDSHPDAFAGSSWFVGLAGGAASVGDFTTAVEELAADLSLPPEASEFSVVDVSDTSVAAAAVDNSALLLGRALMALAVAAIVVGGFGVLQTLARHHTASARAREIEPALGLTRGQQAAARLVTGLVPAVLAAVITGVAALLTARVEPIGAIHLYEPHPGAALNLTVMGVGVVSVLLAVLLAAVLTGRPSGRRAEPLRESSIVARVTRLGGSPPTVLGLRFALEAGRGSRAVPVRSAIAGAIVGVAGVVGGLLFVSSLDRLTTSPSRSATPFDAYVSDVKVADFRDEVLPDPLVGDVAIVRSAPVTLDQLTVSGHAVDELRGPLDIGLESGRMPRTPDEITLGLRLARDLGLDVGDPVAVRRPNGRVRELAVVGLAVIPPFNGEELGLNALLTNEGLDANASAAAFTSAAVEAAPGVDVDALMEVLSARYEAEVQSRPVAVLNLEQLGRLPEAVAVLVGSIAVFALANALVVAVRRRRRDLAVLRALGCTRRETATSVLVMALTIVGLGVIVGVPLGIAIGSTLWRATAAGAFVLADPAIRWELVLVPVGAAIAIALLAAAIPAGQAAGQSPADGLRVE